MAEFTLLPAPPTGVEILARTPLLVPDNSGDLLVIVDRLLDDKRGNLRGTLVFRSVIIKSSQP